MIRKYGDVRSSTVTEWESEDKFEDSNDYLWFMGSAKYIIELTSGSDGSGITDLR